MNKKLFAFEKQPKTKKQEIAWLRNVIWYSHCYLQANNKWYQKTFLKNEYFWVLFFTQIVQKVEKVYDLTLTSGWYLVTREYYFLPEAWNSLPFKLKIDIHWGNKLREMR